MLCSSLLQAATLTSVVNRNQVGPNETLVLLVSIDEQVEASALDLAPLTQDFEVLATSPNTSTSVSITNGQTTRQATTSWRISLLPKRTGKLTIPALQLQGATSKPISISVFNTPSSTTGLPALTAELTIDTNQVLPGQQVLVTATLNAATNVSNLTGPPLNISNAEVIELDQKVSQLIENGIARQSIELSYAVFFSSPGSITIPALTFSGVEGGGSGLFSTRGRQVVARTQPTEINVLSKPKNAPSPWIVTKKLTISSEWANDTAEFRVGEPVTRRIIIEAQGQPGEAIPVLLTQDPISGVQTYFDQPQIDTRSSANGLQGVRTESVALIPNREGSLELPELSLSYWNPATNRLEIAQLSAQTIEVLPALALNGQNSPPAEPVVTIQKPNQSANGPQPAALLNWQIATLVLLGLLVLQSAYLWSSLRKKHGVSKTSRLVESEQESHQWAALKKALSNKRLSDARSTLSKWLIVLHGQRLSLDQLAQDLSKDGRETLQALEQTLYKDQAEVDLDFGELLDELSKYRQQTLKSQKSQHTIANDDLVPIYPKNL